MFVLYDCPNTSFNASYTTYFAFTMHSLITLNIQCKQKIQGGGEEAHGFDEIRQISLPMTV